MVAARQQPIAPTIGETKRTGLGQTFLLRRPKGCESRTRGNGKEQRHQRRR
jgi:hypothetical protein